MFECLSEVKIISLSTLQRGSAHVQDLEALVLDKEFRERPTDDFGHAVVADVEFAESRVLSESRGEMQGAAHCKAVHAEVEPLQSSVRLWGGSKEVD